MRSGGNLRLGRLGSAHWSTHWVLAQALLLAACASPQSEAARVAPSVLIGMPKGALLSCAGVPERSIVAGGAEYLTYSRQQTIVERDVDYEPWPWMGRGSGFPRLFRPEISTLRRDYRCDATFALRNGIVERLEYNLNRDLTLCGAIVANCVPTPEQRR